jgi:hypothetical protein
VSLLGLPRRVARCRLTTGSAHYHLAILATAALPGSRGARCGTGRGAREGLMLRISRFFCSDTAAVPAIRRLENARNWHKLTIVAAVAPTRRNAIKRVQVGGER